jgi:hypothetical protein
MPETVPTMRPTPTRLIRVVPRKLLNVSDQKIIARPTPQTADKLQPTLMDIMMKRKEEAGDSWPANLRLEPQLTSKVFKAVQPGFRSTMRRMTKER